MYSNGLHEVISEYVEWSSDTYIYFGITNELPPTGVSYIYDDWVDDKTR